MAKDGKCMTPSLNSYVPVITLLELT
jgi:hypothetical protein